MGTRDQLGILSSSNFKSDAGLGVVAIPFLSINSPAESVDTGQGL